MTDVNRHRPMPVLSPAAGAAGAMQTHHMRWLVALLTTALMLLGSLGVAVFAADGAAQASAGPTYLPASSLLYAEARLDLPGDQRTQAMAFLAHIPGFEDPSTFDTKMGAAIDQMLGSGSGLTYTADIKPWSNGLVSVGVPSLTPVTSGTSGSASTEVVIALGVADRAVLDTTLQSLVTAAASGGTVTTEDYDGTTITTITPSSGSAKVLAPTDSYLLLASQASTIKSSLDVLAGTSPSLAQDPGFQTAWSGLPSDRLAAFYVDGTQMAAAIKAQSSAQGTTASSAAVMDAILANIPDHIVGALRADADHLTALLQAPVVAGAAPMAIRATDLAAHMPSTALAYVEVRDLGAIVDGLLGQVVAGMSAGSSAASLQQVQGLLGTSLGNFFDFTQDGALMIADDGTTLSAGSVATLTDEAAGTKRLQVLLSLLAMFGSGASSPVAVSTEQVNGTTVTTITLDSSAGLLPANLPFPSALSVAIADGHMYVGVGDFAKTAISQDPTTSLASNPRYAAAVAAAGSPNGGLLWLDMVGLQPLLESTMTATSRTAYEANTKPYYDHLDYLVASLNQANGLSTAQAQVYVK